MKHRNSYRAMVTVCTLALVTSLQTTMQAQEDGNPPQPTSVTAALDRLVAEDGYVPAQGNDVDVAPEIWGDSCNGGLCAGGGCGGSCCDSQCRNSCQCKCCRPPKLFGLIAGSDPCFMHWISPVSNPVLWEDPRTLTELRPMFIHQNLNSGVLAGDAYLVAMQARAALTDRLSIIASKDGYVWLETDDIPTNDGWADIAAGLKYNLIRNPERQILLSSGFTYEIDLGSSQVFQGHGDGEFHFFLSSGAQLVSGVHFLSGAGFRIPTNHNARSQMFYWSNHVDAELLAGIFGWVEFNWYHWLRSGSNPALAGVEGLDLMNFGSTGVAGKDIVTAALGVTHHVCKNEIAVGWEFPLTDERDLLDNRLYVDWHIRY